MLKIFAIISYILCFLGLNITYAEAPETQYPPITDGAPIIYTERKEGVIPAYDVRTDRFEIAVEAMGKVVKSNIAKREQAAAKKAAEAARAAEAAAAAGTAAAATTV